MQAQQVAEEQRKNGKYNKTLWIIYVCLVVFIGVLAFVRLIALFRRITWRNDLDGTVFPECGDWSVDEGCTRITLNSSECVKAKSIPDNNSVIFDVSVDRLLNTQIQYCVRDIKGAKLQSPKDLSDKNTHGNLIHVTFNSAIFGFIDDLYIMTYLYEPTVDLSMRKISIMSQLRMGSYDFDQNYDHVNQVLDCLNDTFMNYGTQPAPCSQ